MNKLISEQLPNDGGYHIKRLVNEANERLGQIGRRGKRAKIVAKRSSLTLQFSFKDGNGGAQKNVGIGAIPLSPQGIVEAEKIATMVTNQLMANSFTWDWFNNLIGKDTSEQAKQLTCKEMVEQFKKHFFKERNGNKTIEKSWYEREREIELFLKDLNKPLTLEIVREVIESSQNNSNRRKRILQGMVEFLKFFGNNDFKDLIENYKVKNKPKRKSRNVPSSEQITKIYQTRFTPKPKCAKRLLHRYPQWQFLFGLLATYGLRVHEAWNIANWDKPVTLKDGDWVEIKTEDDGITPIEENSDILIVPAILDPNNKRHLLCIKHDTKTGYRTVLPLSPEGRNWMKEFSLLQPLNLPDTANPLGKSSQSKSSYNCTRHVCRWFNSNEFGFVPHDLRHAYTIRGHALGINPKVLADSAGHSLKMSSTTYLKHMSDREKVKGMVEAVTKEQEKRSEVELANQRIKELEAQLEARDKEIELLKTKIQLNEAYREK